MCASENIEVRLNLSNHTIEFEDGRPEPYYVDLDRCVSSAEVLDSLIQVRDKAWCTDDIAGKLLWFISEILNPQGSLCSFGSDKRLTQKQLYDLIERNGRRVLREHPEVAWVQRES